MSAQLQWAAFCRTGFTSWRVFPECKGDLPQTCCSLWKVKLKNSLGRNEDAFARKLVKEWTVTASLSLPSWWQMSSPVGGYLHRKIVQQTNCQKLNRCLWISSSKFKSYSMTELFTEKNGLGASQTPRFHPAGSWSIWWMGLIYWQRKEEGPYKEPSVRIK